MPSPGDRCSFFRLSVLLLSLVNAASPEGSGSVSGDYVPLVIWHGMGKQGAKVYSHSITART